MSSFLLVLRWFWCAWVLNPGYILESPGELLNAQVIDPHSQKFWFNWSGIRSRKLPRWVWYTASEGLCSSRLVQLPWEDSQLTNPAAGQRIQEQLKEKNEQTMSRLIWSQGSLIFDLLMCDNYYILFFFMNLNICVPVYVSNKISFENSTSIQLKQGGKSVGLHLGHRSWERLSDRVRWRRERSWWRT